MDLKEDALVSLKSELNALELKALEPKLAEAKGKEKPAAKETPAAKRQKNEQVPPAAGSEPAPPETEPASDTQAAGADEDAAGPVVDDAAGVRATAFSSERFPNSTWRDELKLVSFLAQFRSDRMDNYIRARLACPISFHE